MKFNFFHKKVCQGSTESNDCSLVVELRQLQKELDAVNKNIQQLKNRQSYNTKEITTFLSCSDMKSTVIELYVGYQNVDVVACISRAIKDLTNFDNFIQELTTIYNNSTLITKEQNKATKLSDKISNIKEKLGIK